MCIFFYYFFIVVCSSANNCICKPTKHTICLPRFSASLRATNPLSLPYSTSLAPAYIPILRGSPNLKQRRKNWCRTHSYVWLHRFQLTEIQNPSAWIYRVASNEAFNFLKRKGIEQKVLQVIGPSDELSNTDDIAYNELKRNVAEAVVALP